MAEVSGSTAGGSVDSQNVRQRGAQVVRALAQVGEQLHPLQQKLDAGEKLTKRQVKRLGMLQSQYRDLERQLRELMRPRVKDPWMTGADHVHGPDGAIDVEP
jgi:hypothetical protein